MNNNRPHNCRGELLENQLRAHQKGGLSGWWQETVKRDKDVQSEEPGKELPPTLAGWVTCSSRRLSFLDCGNRMHLPRHAVMRVE